MTKAAKAGLWVFGVGPLVAVPAVLLFAFARGNLWIWLFLLGLIAVVALQLGFVARFYGKGRYSELFARYFGVRVSIALAFIWIAHPGWGTLAKTAMLYVAIDATLLAIRFFEKRQARLRASTTSFPSSS